MTTLVVGTNESPAGVTPILVGKLVLVNHDPHNLKQKGLSPVTTKRGEIICVYPDLLEEKQLSASNRRRKSRTCNAISINLKEEHSIANTLTESEGEAIALTTHQDEAT